MIASLIVSEALWIQFVQVSEELLQSIDALFDSIDALRNLRGFYDTPCEMVVVK